MGALAGEVEDALDGCLHGGPAMLAPRVGLPRGGAHCGVRNRVLPADDPPVDLTRTDMLLAAGSKP